MLNRTEHRIIYFKCLPLIKWLCCLCVYSLIASQVSLVLAQRSSVEEPISGGPALLIHKAQGFHADSQALIFDANRYYGTSLAMTFVANNGKTLHVYPRNNPYIIPYPSLISNASPQSVIDAIDVAIKRFPAYQKRLVSIKALWISRKVELEEIQSKALVEKAHFEREAVKQKQIEAEQIQKKIEAEQAQAMIQELLEKQKAAVVAAAADAKQKEVEKQRAQDEIQKKHVEQMQILQTIAEQKQIEVKEAKFSEGKDLPAKDRISDIVKYENNNSGADDPVGVFIYLIAGLPVVPVVALFIWAIWMTANGQGGMPDAETQRRNIQILGAMQRKEMIDELKDIRNSIDRD